DQVDPAGDRLDSVDNSEQVLAAGVGMAGVQAEARPVLANGIPEAGQRVEPARAGVVAAGGVLDQDRQRISATLRRVAECLAPVLEARLEIPAAVDVPTVDDQTLCSQLGGRGRVLHEQLSARDAAAVVGGRNVEAIRR